MFHKKETQEVGMPFGSLNPFEKEAKGNDC